MELRRKNEYLETLFENANAFSKESLVNDKEEKQTGGGDTNIIFNNLLKSINEFTDKWKRKSSMEYRCDETKIENGNIHITLNTDLTTYFP